eukprot:TRINITY_DN988_c0_g1_i1.p1 TRINITY_DN988_c0_g1~~TRINITY_DN988_c0_g1_i1.p1  ORF type:complete len:618 (-),score=40.90 TRINITY_DN988_c0_g1_i1:846-2432(-)
MLGLQPRRKRTTVGTHEEVPEASSHDPINSGKDPHESLPLIPADEKPAVSTNDGAMPGISLPVCGFECGHETPSASSSFHFEGNPTFRVSNRKSPLGTLRNSGGTPLESRHSPAPSRKQPAVAFRCNSAPRCNGRDWTYYSTENFGPPLEEQSTYPSPLSRGNCSARQFCVSPVVTRKVRLFSGRQSRSPHRPAASNTSGGSPPTALAQGQSVVTTPLRVRPVSANRDRIVVQEIARTLETLELASCTVASPSELARPGVPESTLQKSQQSSLPPCGSHRGTIEITASASAAALSVLAASAAISAEVNVKVTAALISLFTLVAMPPARTPQIATPRSEDEPIGSPVLATLPAPADVVQALHWFEEMGESETCHVPVETMAPPTASPSVLEKSSSSSTPSSAQQFWESVRDGHVKLADIVNFTLKGLAFKATRQRHCDWKPWYVVLSWPFLLSFDSDESACPANSKGIIFLPGATWTVLPGYKGKECIHFKQVTIPWTEQNKASLITIGFADRSTCELWANSLSSFLTV